MRRREFIALAAGAAGWPLAARAQQPERMRRIGLLTAGTAADDPDAQARNVAFLQVMQQLGWAEGRNLRIDYFWGLAQADTIRKQAAELAALAPDVILSSGESRPGSIVAGDAHGADRVRECHRPGRRWLRR